ncbi:MAG: transposase [Epsilonproteobacteria bacterium]|nr:transposase [Campylobacterota bacterium]
MIMISLEDLVPSDHVYRRFLKIWDFSGIQKLLKEIEKSNNYKGYGADRLFKCLILQFLEDLSDRELERFIQENVAGKLFCGFELNEHTPDHSVFGRIRNRIGTKKLSEIFSNLRDQLKAQGYMNEVFSFVDASSLISKANLWKERDKAIKEKYDKLNNEVLPKVAFDKQAKIGCKGKDKYWYGYKKHACVDMQSGLINKVAVTPANIPDAKAYKNVCPNQGATYADKGYCTKEANRAAKRKGCHLRAIKKNNMKDKNKDLDRWISSIRAPYESVFSKQRKRVRYCGIAKNQFAAFMEAICFNLKRIGVLDPPGVVFT